MCRLPSSAKKTLGVFSSLQTIGSKASLLLQVQNRVRPYNVPLSQSRGEVETGGS